MIKFNRNKFMKIATLAVVLVIPLIYSCFYLGAFWDPMEKTDQLPVAVVNNDALEMGAGLVQQLQASGNLKYNFGENDISAAKALKKGKYYAVITIPADFTVNIIGGSATIIYSANEGSSYLASQILNNAVMQIEKSMRETVNVKVVYSPINHVPNYGTAFAPYFICLSLWLGGIVIFFGIYLDHNKRLKTLALGSPHGIRRNLWYIAIGLVQALILSVFGFAFLGISIQHLALYMIACFLISVTFVSIIAFLFQFLKDAGKFLALLLLILQLSACAGTYPVETLPGFFKVLQPVMPMTYGVDLLRQTISFTDFANVWVDFVILLGISVVFAILNFVLVSRRKRCIICKRKSSSK